MTHRWHRVTGRSDDDGRGEGGYTLVEMLVVMILMGVVGSLVASTIVLALRTETRQVDTGQALGTSKTAFERMTRELRAANPVLSATDTSIKVQTSDDTTQRTLTYSAITSGGKRLLVVDEIDETLSNGATVTRPQRTLLDRLSTSQSVIFSYYDENGAALPAQTTSPNTYNPAGIETVSVTVVETLFRSTSTFTLTDRINLRNYS